MEDLNKQLKEALDAFKEATEQHEVAERLASEARNRETHCKNKLTEAQKAIDALMVALKKGAPRDSDWHRATVKLVQI